MKRKTCTGSALILLLLALVAPSLAQADSAAPALYGVKDIILQNAHFANAKSAESCGLSTEAVGTRLLTLLLDLKLPVTAATEAKPPMIGIARIELVPSVSSISDESLDCTSWVTLTAQSSNDLRIVPVDVPRSVKVIYWQTEAMVSSGQSGHERLVGETLQKMAQTFAEQYKGDQPFQPK